MRHGIYALFVRHRMTSIDTALRGLTLADALKDLKNSGTKAALRHTCLN